MSSININIVSIFLDRSQCLILYGTLLLKTSAKWHYDYTLKVPKDANSNSCQRCCRVQCLLVIGKEIKREGNKNSTYSTTQ